MTLLLFLNVTARGDAEKDGKNGKEEVARQTTLVL